MKREARRKISVVQILSSLSPVLSWNNTSRAKKKRKRETGVKVEREDGEELKKNKKVKREEGIKEIYER